MRLTDLGVAALQHLLKLRGQQRDRQVARGADDHAHVDVAGMDQAVAQAALGPRLGRLGRLAGWQ